MSINKSLEAELTGQLGYSNAPMNPPPSEKKATVIQFSLTNGCSHHRCTFCNMYDQDNQKYSVKSLPEFKDHVNKVLEYRRKNKKLIGVSRIFLGAGNALSVDTELLLQASQYSLLALKNAVPGRNTPRRLSIYGNTNDILGKDINEMGELFCGGTCFSGCSIGYLGERRGVDVIYWGVESGNNEVLKIAGKGYTGNDAVEAGILLKNIHVDEGHIRSSVMIMPGLGGIAHSEGHIKDTIKLLNEINPTWITFIGLKINPDTPYSKWIEREEARKLNRRLTPEEITEQTARMIEGLDFSTTIGVHNDDVTPIGHNPVSIGVAKINDRFDAQEVARKLRSVVSK